MTKAGVLSDLQIFIQVTCCILLSATHAILLVGLNIKLDYPI
jgi:hypothetical protein